MIKKRQVIVKNYIKNNCAWLDKLLMASTPIVVSILVGIMDIRTEASLVWLGMFLLGVLLVLYNLDRLKDLSITVLEVSAVAFVIVYLFIEYPPVEEIKNQAETLLWSTGALFVAAFLGYILALNIRRSKENKIKT